MSSCIVFQPIDNQSLGSLIERAHLRPDEIITLESISNPKRKREWLTSKVIAWEKWHQHIDYLPSGAPTIDFGFISISHTDTHIAMIFSDDSPVGIDIESSDRDAARIARKFATPAEIELAHALYPTNPELLVWCAKEALYKWAGREGVEFLTDLEIVGNRNCVLQCRALKSPIDVQVSVQGELLICYCN